MQQHRINKALARSSQSKYWRHIFLGFGIIFLLVSLIWVIVDADDIQEVETKEVSIEKKVVQPIFDSKDDKRNSYRIMADEAKEIAAGEYLLHKPRAKLFGKKIINIEGMKGRVFLQGKKRVRLTNKVIFEYADIYKLYTDTLDIDLGEKKAFSPGVLQGDGKYGRFKALSASVSYKDSIIRLEGPVDMVIYEEGV